MVLFRTRGGGEGDKKKSALLFGGFMNLNFTRGLWWLEITTATSSLCSAPFSDNLCLLSPQRVKDILICCPTSLKPWYGEWGQLLFHIIPSPMRGEVMFVKMWQSEHESPHSPLSATLLLYPGLIWN